jgi:hypothetical protein
MPENRVRPGSELAVFSQNSLIRAGHTTVLLPNGTCYRPVRSAGRALNHSEEIQEHLDQNLENLTGAPSPRERDR